MPPFDFSKLNASMINKFGEPCTYFPVGSTAPVASSFPINLNNKDLLRKEGMSPANFAIRWAQKADFDAQGYVPQKNDRVILENGLPYLVEDVQADGGQGYDLVLKKTR